MTGRSKLGVRVDMALCLLRYGATPANYYLFGWGNVREAPKRKGYLTYADNQRLIRNLNPREGVAALDDKGAFLRRFRSILGRSALILDETSRQEVLHFLRRTERIVVKGRLSDQGRNIKILDSGEDLPAMCDYLWRNRAGRIVEGYVHQHSTLTRSFGTGLAAVRLVSARQPSANTRHIMAAISVSSPDVQGGVVNLHTGALMAAVDVDTGRIKGPARNKEGLWVEMHPETRQPFDQFQLPMWSETLELASKAMELCPEAGYVGWDVGISEEGPCLIEGNSKPGTYGWTQHPIFGTECGLRNLVRDLL